MSGRAARPGPPAGALRRHRVPSRILREERLVRVLAPERPRGLLLLNDGQNVFSRPQTVGAREKWAAEAAAALVPGLAVVAIDSARDRRGRDYLPYANPADPLGRRPRGDRYVAFLVEELLGWLAERYPQLARPGHTGIGGSSYGAVSALHAALRYPDAFDRLLLESPSLFIGGRRLIRDTRDAVRLPTRVHLAIGTAEARDPELSARVLADAVELAAVLRERGLGPRRLRFRIDEGAAHHERHWARRLPEALRFLFS